MNILNALSSGQSAIAILGALASLYPNLANRVKEAQKIGHNLEDVLKAFQGLSKKQLKDLDKEAAMSSNPLIAASDATKATSGQALSEKLYPALGKAALAAGTAYGASKLLPKAAQAVQSFFPTPSNPLPASPTQPNLPLGQGVIGPHPMANAPVSPPPIAQTQPPDVAAAATAQPPAPVAAAPLIDSLSVLKEMGLEPRIDALLKAGNPPETVGKALEHFLTPGQKKWLAEGIKAGQAKTVPEMVQDYIAAKQKASVAQPIIESEADRTVEMAAKPKKGSIVATPNGVVGTVKDLKEKDALIESDGKLNKAKAEDLVPIPKEDQDFDFRKLAEIYKSKFPKEGAGSLSDNLASVFHGPENNTLFVSFVTSPGKGYIYRNVPKELYEKVLSQSVAPKTKGTGIFGGWNPDVVDSRGAAFQEIKANPDKYPFEVVEMGYNMLEPLIQAIAEMQKEEQRKNAQAKKQAKRKPS